MDHVFNTIIPVFVVIALGWLLRIRGLLPLGLMGALNRMVYYLALPALIFREIAGASASVQINPRLLVGTLTPLPIISFLAFLATKPISVSSRAIGTFIQSSSHGNLGYIGLAVVYYYLGREGFTTATILAGFLMLLQNIISVVVLQIFSQGAHGSRTLYSIKKVLGNPVILAAMGGMFFSIAGVGLPEILSRSLGIVGNMALPLALIVIGGSLSFELIRSHLGSALAASLFKVLLMPAMGWVIYHSLGVGVAEFLPGLILLASPTASIAYVMAVEMGGCPELASASISIGTLASLITYVGWLSLSG
jgi:predicted permease